QFSSEGQAGVLAGDFAQFLAVVVRMPYWRDVLHYSGNGELSEMRRAAEAFEGDFAGDEDLVIARRSLIRSLAISEDADIVARLHAAVSSSAGIRDQWGQDAAPLFGRFTIDDNPMFGG